MSETPKDNILIECWNKIIELKFGDFNPRLSMVIEIYVIHTIDHTIAEHERATIKSEVESQKARLSGVFDKIDVNSE